MAALYLPGSWIRKGNTELTVFEAQANGGMDVSSIDHILYIEPPVSVKEGKKQVTAIQAAKKDRSGEESRSGLSG